jgi:hypothetical protein
VHMQEVRELLKNRKKKRKKKKEKNK